MDRAEAAHIANQARHNISPEREHAIAKKAAETRLRNNPNAFKEMGEKGGRAGGRSGGSKSDQQEDQETG